MPRNILLQFRRDTAAHWSTANPVLADGEPGYEHDSRKVKFGDGVTAWNDLPYSSDSSSSGAVGPAGPAGPKGDAGAAGPQGIPGLLVLGPLAPVPAGTPIGTVIFRTN